MSSIIPKNFQNIFVTNITPISGTGPTYISATNITGTNLVASTSTISNIILTGNFNANGTSNTLANIYTTSGNVGINTTSPAVTFDVIGSGRFTNLFATFTSLGNLTSSTGTFANKVGGSQTVGTLVITTSASLIGNTNTIGSIFTTGGNVGINTTSPGFTLDVNGTGRFTNFISTNITTSSILATNVILTSGSFGNISSSNISVSGNMTIGGNLLVAGTLIAVNTTSVNIIDNNITAGTLNAGSITSSNLFSTNNSLTNLISTNASISNILSTNSTVTNLVLTSATFANTIVSAQTIGTLTVTTSASLIGNTNTIGSIFTTGGNVGINTTSPGFTLDVNGTGRITNLTSTTSTIGNLSNTNLISTNITTTNVLATFISSGNIKVLANGNIITNNENGTTHPIHIYSTSGPNSASSASFYLGPDATNNISYIQTSKNGANLNLCLNPRGGNVGINTTSPGFALDVNGNIRTSTVSGTNTFINTSSATSMPLTILTPNLASSGNYNYTYFGQSLSNNNSGQLNFQYFGNNNTTNNISLSFFGGATGTPFTISANGNIGLNNITTPIYPLHVSGNIYAGTSSFTSSGSGTLNTIGLYTKGVFNSGVNGFPAISGTTGNAIALRVRGSDDAVVDFGVNSTFGGWLQTTNYGIGYNQNYPLLLNPNGGNVGINNTSPAFTFDVNGTSRITSTLSLTNGFNGTTALNNNLLFIKSSGDFYHFIANGAAYNISNYAGDGTIITGNVGGALAYQGGTVQSTNVAKLTWNSVGVGINTTNPAFPLDVNGLIRSINLAPVVGSNDLIHLGQSESNNNMAVIDYNYTTIGSSLNSIGLGFYGANNKLVVQAGGNVGINTANPQFTLDVLGSSRMSGSLNMTNSNSSYTSTTGGNVFANYLGYSYSSGIVCNGFSFSSPYFMTTQYVNNLDTVYLYTPGAGSGSAKMSILSNGNVGINTTSPGFTLDVNGSGRFNNITAQRFNSYTGTINISTTGTYNISPGILGYIGKISVYIGQITSGVWGAQGDLIMPPNNNIRGNLSNITQYQFSNNAISATLQPFGGSNNSGVTNDNPSGSVQVVVTTLNSATTIYWTLTIFSLMT